LQYVFVAEPAPAQQQQQHVSKEMKYMLKQVGYRRKSAELLQQVWYTLNSRERWMG
jgi:ABC-type molybdenum transport system ATPase subunit/photorepair protein PhrA